MVVKAKPKELGAVIKEAREAKGLTQVDLIGDPTIQLSSTYLSKIEVEGEIPTPLVLCLLAKKLGLSVKAVLAIALENKVRKFEASWKKKYRDALKTYAKDTIVIK